MKNEDVKVGDYVMCIDPSENTRHSVRLTNGKAYKVRLKAWVGDRLESFYIKDDDGYLRFASVEAFEPDNDMLRWLRIRFPKEYEKPEPQNCRCVNIHIDKWGDIEKSMKQARQKMANMSKPQIDRVIFNDPATVVFWKDGTKTVSKCQNGDTFSEWVGLAICHFKKAYGSEHDKAYIERVIKRARRNG